MAFKCPSCETVHETVPGYVSQEKLTERINAKTAEINALTTRVKELESSSSEAVALKTERDRLQLELSSLKESATVAAAFATHGIADDEAGQMRNSFRLVYDSQMAGLEEGTEKPSFAEWLATDEAKAHPILQPHYKAEVEENTTPNTPPGSNAPVRTPPNTDQHTTPPPSNTAPKVITGADLVTLFHSPQYKALPFKTRKALREQWQAELKAGTMTAVPTVPAPTAE